MRFLGAYCVLIQTRVTIHTTTWDANHALQGKFKENYYKVRIIFVNFKMLKECSRVD